MLGESPCRAPAVIGESPTLTLTYQELSDHTERLAGRMWGAGLQPGDSVAVLLPNGPAFVVIFLGATLLQEPDFDRVLEAISVQLQGLTDAEGVALALLDERSGWRASSTTRCTRRCTGSRSTPQASPSCSMSRPSERADSWTTCCA